MKISPSHPLLLLLFVAFMASCSVTSKQGSGDHAADMESLLKSRNFIFKAQSANPLRGNVVQLTSEYDLVMAHDTLRTFLPYFGRAFSAPAYNGEGGIKLSTTDFDYNLSSQRKNRWNLTLKPNDDQTIQQLVLSVSENGFANLRVLSTNRDPITFNGMVMARNK